MTSLILSKPSSIRVADVLKTPREVQQYMSAVEMVLTESVNCQEEMTGGLYMLDDGFGALFSIDGHDPSDTNADPIWVRFFGSKCQGVMTPYALNVGANIIASTVLVYSTTGEFKQRLIDNVFNLKKFAAQLPEATKIFKFID